MAVRIINADVMEGLRQLPDASVHCVVTSPPYYGLRDYGTGTWTGGIEACNHVGHEIRTGAGMEALGEKYSGGGKKATKVRTVQYGQTCAKCGAVRIDDQIGLEPTPDAFVSKLVAVFREVRRVLRTDGVLFLNLGDSYANDGKWGGSTGGKHVEGLHGKSGAGRRKVVTGLKPKDLIGMPWRVALALQADGWWLRQDIIWAKPNPMPESVTDRCTKAHEYIFVLTKSAKYFWDQDAIKERADFGFPNAPDSIASPYGQGFTRRASALDTSARPPGTRPQSGMTRATIGKKGNARGFRGGSYVDGEPGPRTETGNVPNDTFSRNKRSVWTIATTPYPDAHFATFPPELPETCIKDACPAGGRVLDPFGGAGTTGMVADRLGCDAVLIELNPEYAAMARKRVARDRLDRKRGTMQDVQDAALEPTPLEALIGGSL